ncbi:TPA: HNH endonuclease [Salmonella enterica]|nr:HNH endonuclease [Salmonella enterica]
MATNYKNMFNQHLYHDVYFFCHAIKNILNNQSDYIRGLNDFYGDGRINRFDIPFPRWSHFHDFVEFIVLNIYSEDLKHDHLSNVLNNMKNYSSRAVSDDNISVNSFEYIHEKYLAHLNENELEISYTTVSDLEEFLYEFHSSEEFLKHIENTVREVFYILFGNRKVMQDFNEMIARAREDEIDIIDTKYHKDNGVLKRKNIPEWVKNAVYHRDKGRCVVCKKDITRIVNIYNIVNFDHIVPLAMFGLNDISNIQLLCAECNGEKKANNTLTSHDYYEWYEID